MLVFCRAVIPESFLKVNPQQFEQQIEALEERLRMRFIFDSMSIYVHPQNKYILVTDLDELLPRLPTVTVPPSYFRK